MTCNAMAMPWMEVFRESAPELTDVSYKRTGGRAGAHPPSCFSRFWRHIHHPTGLPLLGAKVTCVHGRPLCCPSVGSLLSLGCLSVA